MKFIKFFLSCLCCVLLTATAPALDLKPAAAAPDNDVQTLCNMTLSGREMSYQLYLPANLADAAPEPVTVSRDFNQPDAITPFDSPTRIYWELTVSSAGDGAREKVLRNPELIITPALPNADSQTIVNTWVREAFSGETRSGSFILPARTGMAVRLKTGAWDQQTALFSHHPQAFLCQLIIRYRPADRDLPPALQHLDVPIFNQYINTLIKAKETAIKSALCNESLYDLVFRKVDFRIESGELLIGFTAYYQGRSVLGIPYRTQADGTASFEVRCSGDGTRLGLFCRGLVGSFDIPRDWGLLDRWGRSYIHQKIANQQYWTALPNAAAANPGSAPPSTYLVFKNENLTALINQALLSGQLRPVSYDFLGGAVKISFREVSFQEFNLAAGRAKGLCRLDAELSLLGRDIYRIDNAGTVEPLEFDFYIDANDQSWWGRITAFHIELNGLSAFWNGMVNQIVSKKLAESHGLMPLAIPPSMTGSTR